nr:DUF4113 domain-containing protein [Salmonella enterica]
MRKCARLFTATLRARQKNSAASTSTAVSSQHSSKHPPFALNEPYYGNSAAVTLLTPTQDSRDIINAAVKCLDKIWRDGHCYQKAGVMLGDFFSQGVAQLNLFDDNAPRAGSEKLMEVLDHLNAKDGKGTLYFAGQGMSQQWAMKREMLSPRYTTRYSDLLRVK